MQTGSTSHANVYVGFFTAGSTAISIYVVGSKLQDYRQPLPLETPTSLSSKWLAIGDLRCMDEALLILLIIIH